MSEKLTGGLKGNFSRFLPDSGLVLEGGNISGPNLFDLQVNGTSRFSINKSGDISATAFGETQKIGVVNYNWQFFKNGNPVFYIYSTAGVIVPSGSSYGISSGGIINTFTSDVLLTRKNAANWHRWNIQIFS